eukprot:m.215179 g.215179  ORF g.215179 m.215179 type:complete len:130 (+) comp33186_c2_seq2:159-548(+)
MMGAMFYLALLAAAFCFVTGQPRSEKQWLGAWSVVLDDTFTKSQLETLHNSTRFNVTVVKLSSTMNFIQCQKENGPLRGTHFLETNGTTQIPTTRTTITTSSLRGYRDTQEREWLFALSMTESNMTTMI